MSASSNAPAAVAANPQRHSRERVLLACIILLMAFFGLTAFLARMYHAKFQSLADEWYMKGETSFQGAEYTTALTDFRNALVYSPNNAKFQFHLARALAAAGRLDEARSYLLTLLSESPGGGEINLELARIAARQSNMQDALRYYHGAIYGEWDTDPIAMRWKVRRELCEFMLDHGAANQATGDLLQLADNAPAQGIESQRTAAELLLRAQLWGRALSEFQSVLAADPHDVQALKGAGIAAYQLGRFSAAIEFFGRLPRDQAADPAVEEMNETSRQVLAADPYVPGLSAGARAHRATAALSLAVSRVQQCASQRGIPISDSPPKSELQKVFATGQQMKVNWSERNLERHPDRLEDVMSLAFQMENLATQVCGPPQNGDYALLLLARSRAPKP